MIEILEGTTILSQLSQRPKTSRKWVKKAELRWIHSLNTTPTAVTWSKVP